MGLRISLHLLQNIKPNRTQLQEGFFKVRNLDYIYIYILNWLQFS